MNRMPLTDGKVYCRVTRRVRLLPVSAMYRLLAVVPAVAGNTATPHGYARAALVAGLLSPSVEPPPATVVIFFVLAVTLRIRLMPLSAMKTFPEPSTATA